MDTTNTAPVVNVSEVLFGITDKAKTFVEKCTVVVKDDLTRTVKIPKDIDPIKILGLNRDSLKTTQESLVLALGAVTLYIHDNPTSVVSPTHVQEYTECVIAVTAATAHVMMIKSEGRKDKADLQDKIVRGAGSGLVSFFSKKAEILVNGASTEQTMETTTA